MYHIYKIASNTVVDFAAEELKKYLRMMMPRCGDIPIDYDPNATEGFRLGLMADFGISTAEETDQPQLDDFGKWKLAIEHYYDHFMVRNSLNAIINTKSDFDQ